MNLDRLVRYESDEFFDGIVVSQRNISSKLRLNENSKNISYGGYDGPGPRYGISPIPFHSVIVPEFTDYEAGSEVTSELPADFTPKSVVDRRRTLGWLSFSTLITNSNVTREKRRVYAAIVQDTNNRLIVTQTGERDATTITSDYGYGGLSVNSSGPTALNSVFTRQIPGGTLSEGLTGHTDATLDSALFTFGARTTSTWRLPQIKDYLTLTEPKYHVAVSFLSITGPDFEITEAVATQAESQISTPTGGESTSSNDTPGHLCFSLTGNPNDVFYDIGQSEEHKGVTFYGLETSGFNWAIVTKWAFNTLGELTRNNMRDMMWNENQYSFTSKTTSQIIRTDGSGNARTADLFYVYDALLKHSCRWKYLGLALDGKPYQLIWRDDFNSLSVHAYGTSSSADIYPDNKWEYFDSGNQNYFTRSKSTVTDTAADYTENNVVKGTVWEKFPAFDDETPTTVLSNSSFVIGGANTGLLRANTSYEFTYSMFDKTTNYETNVGVPAKFRTGVDDFTGLFIKKAIILSGTSVTPASRNVFIDGDNSFADEYLANINFLEIRVYYRAIGTFEWLPTLRIPLCQCWHTPDNGLWALATNPVAGLPGGQPGAFIDNSSLPSDEYIDTLSFDNRTFWLSRQSLRFSTSNQPLAYPVRNAVPSPRGEYRGMVTRTYPGEAAQSARIVVAGSEEMYVGRFVPGGEVQQRVQIGPNDAGTFPLDGSNFRIEAWTSDTAFSGRSMVVAEGVLYYWGPNGIFRDGGVEIPNKISTILEPWIQQIYNHNETDKINGVYNGDTEEVIWFYPPQSSSASEQSSQALVFNTKTSTWSRFTFTNTVVDWSQRLEDTRTDNDSDGLAGTRILLGIREPNTILSRSVFFDQFVYAGDMQRDSLYLVKQVAHPDTETRRLIFTNGPDDIDNKTGTAIVQGFNKYTGRPEDVDGIYTIIDSGTGYIDINRKDATNDFLRISYNAKNYFPVWIASEHSFDVVIDTQYWAPAGMKAWHRWLYAHTSWQVDLATDQPGDSYEIDVKFYTLQGTDHSSSTISLSDNSKGNCQILDAIPYTKDNASGQALRLTLTVTHLAGRYNVQYVALDANPESTSALRYWEG